MENQDTKYTRYRTLEAVKQYFLHNHVEDPFDGTNFDCDFLNAIESLKEKYGDKS